MARLRLLRHPLEWQLPLLIVGLLLAVTAAISAAAYFEVKRSALIVAGQRLHSVSQQMAELMGLNARQLLVQTRRMADAPAVRGLLRHPPAATQGALRDSAVAALRRIVTQAEQTPAIEVWDTSGTLLLAIDGRGATSAGRSPGPPSPARDSGAVGGFIAPDDSTMLYPATVSVLDGGTPIGSVVQWRRLATSARGQEQFSRLIGSQAALLVGNRDGSAWSAMSRRAAPIPIDTLRDGIQYHRAGAGERYAAMSGVAGAPWIVAVEFPLATVMAPPRAVLRRLALIAAAFLVLTSLVGWHVSRRIAAERHRAEEVLAQSNDELARTNTELERFSYSVSHDLRAPLRAINGYARAVVEDHAAALNVDGRRLLGVISDNARHMGALIDALLNFSRLGRQAVSRREVDMDAITASVVRDALHLVPSWHGSVFQEPMPAAWADPALLRQVVSNLVANAIKFSGTKIGPRVTIGARPEGADTVYYVRDNGVGFDMQYADKLFGVFSRLHRAEDFEGTGVGLALSQRIVLRHGGRIWAESEVGAGATFSFTLPREPAS